MSYAIVWQEGDGILYAGKLELLERRLELEGLSRLGRALSRTIGYDDVRAIRSARHNERIGGRPTLVVEQRDAPPLRIGTVGGGGMLPEVAERLTADAFAG